MPDRISIHAPAKGATLTVCRWRRASGRYFNPRSREGSDLQVAKSNPANQGISIHAPAKGATRHTPSTGSVLYISIHAPAKGATSDLCHLIPPYAIFQSTLPRRERPARRKCPSVHHHISIHAPAKGATAGVGKNFFRYGHFNPRSREGSDLPATPVRASFRISIHAPAKGSVNLVSRAGISLLG